VKLAPASIPYRAFQKASSVAIGGVFLATAGGLGTAVGAALAVAAVVAASAYEMAYYRRFDYRPTDDTFDIASGVISRREREIPYRRIQNVDISRNVLQRALGIAALDVETAGGSSTEGAIRYVTAAEAQRLQAEIRRRKAAADQSDATRSVAAGSAHPAGSAASAGSTDAAASTVSTASAASGGAAGSGGAAADEELFEIAPSELALVGALSFDPRLFGLIAFLGSGSVPVVASALPALSTLAVTLAGVLVAGGLLVASWLLGVVAAVTNYYGFSLSRYGEELRYERGLFRRYSGSIPLSKIQSLSIRDNPLKRAFGYATLSIETAGYAAGQGGDYGSQAAVPLAERERVARLARRVESFGEPDFRRPPSRVRTRYAIRYAAAAVAVVGLLFAADRLAPVRIPWYLAAGLLLAVPPAAHLKWRHRGWWLGEAHLVTRNGFWSREIRVVPYYRVQTVIDSRTVFQRRWDIATVVADTAGSRSILGAGAAAVDVEATTAAALREELNDRLEAAVARRRRPIPFEWPAAGGTDADAGRSGPGSSGRGSAGGS